MNTDLKARAEALLAALKVDGFRYIAGRPLDDLPWLKEALAAFMEAADAATVLNLLRERDEARKQVDGFRLSQSLDKDSAYVIRELLDRHNVPAAAFIDDHVANAIAQRDAAEAALSAEREEVERLLSAMDREEAYLHRMIDASEENGGIMHGDLEGAFHRIRDKDSDDAERAEALTKETPHAG